MCMLTALETELRLLFERIYGNEWILGGGAVATSMQACRPMLEDAKRGSGARTSLRRRARADVALRVKVLLRVTVICICSRPRNWRGDTCITAFAEQGYC